MNSLPLYGNVICQNAIYELPRTLDSLSKVCDAIYVCDGYSTDGTWEYLQNVKNIYNLKLFQNKFINFRQQRNYLLSNTPQNSWICALDQDETFTFGALANLRTLLHSVDISDQTRPTVLNLPFYTLQDSPWRYTPDVDCILAFKVFLYHKGIEWINEYHCAPGLKEDWDGIYNYLNVNDPSIGVKHWAWLNPKRQLERCKRLKDNKDAGEQEYKNHCVDIHQSIELPEELW